MVRLKSCILEPVVQIISQASGPSAVSASPAAQVGAVMNNNGFDVLIVLWNGMTP